MWKIILQNTERYHFMVPLYGIKTYGSVLIFVGLPQRIEINRKEYQSWKGPWRDHLVHPSSSRRPCSISGKWLIQALFKNLQRWSSHSGAAWGRPTRLSRFSAIRILGRFTFPSPESPHPIHPPTPVVLAELRRGKIYIYISLELPWTLARFEDSNPQPYPAERRSLPSL